MNKQELAEKVFIEVGSIAKTADFISAGLKSYDLSFLCQNDIIRRVRPGYYQLSKYGQASDEILLSKMLPQGIICMESALFHYGYCELAPAEWTVAVPRTMSRTVKQMQAVPLKAYYIQKDHFEIGKTLDYFNDVQLAVYDRERTICDCFKHRSKLENELFNKAVNAYAADKSKNLANLYTYAVQLRLYNKVMNVMEVLLNT